MKSSVIINRITKLDSNKKDILRTSQNDNNSSYFNKENIVSSIYLSGTHKARLALSRTKEYKDIETFIPDLTIAKKIIVSNIVAPDDLINTIVNFTLPKLNIPVAVRENILSSIKNHLEDNYDFSNIQYDVVEKALFDVGAYCQLIIPFEEYDKVTGCSKNGTRIESDIMEAISKKANGKKFNSSVGKIMLTNDISELRLANKVEDDKIYNFKVETDNINKLKNNDVKIILDAILDTSTANHNEDYIILNSNGVNNKKPLVLDISPEAIIPISDASNPSMHYGYFILLDDDGNPLSSINSIDAIGDTNRAYGYAGMLTELNPQSANNIMTGDTSADNASHARLDETLFTNTINEVIEEKLKDIIKDKDLKSSDMSLIMKIMFKRALSNLNTKVLFIPESSLAYYTFKYAEDGCGESIYRDLKDLLSMKKFLLIITYLAYIEKLIPNVNVELDLSGISSNNIQKYIDEVKHIAISERLNPFVNLGTDPYNLTNIIRSHGINLNITHDEEKLPKITKSIENLDFPVVDDELIKIIDSAIYNKLGILASVIQDGFENEYAVIASGKQKIIGKISKQRADMHMQNMSAHASKILMNDGIIREKIKSIIRENIKTILGNSLETVRSKYEDESEIIDYIFNKVVLDLRASLPIPPSDSDKEQIEKIETLTDGIEKIIEKIFSKDAFPAEFYGEKVSENIESLGKIFMSKLTTDKLRELPYFKDFIAVLDDFFTDGSDDNITKEIIHKTNILNDKLFGPLNKLTKNAKLTDERYEKLNGEEDEEDSDDDKDNDNDNKEIDSDEDNGMNIDDFDDKIDDGDGKDEDSEEDDKEKSKEDEEDEEDEED